MVTYSEKKRGELYKRAFELLMKNYEIYKDEKSTESERSKAHYNYSDLSAQLDTVDRSDDDEADFAYGALEASVERVEAGKPPRVLF